MFSDSLKQKHPHDDARVLLKMVCGGEDYRLRNNHKATLGGIQHRRGVGWRGSLMVGLGKCSPGASSFFLQAGDIYKYFHNHRESPVIARPKAQM